jgi:hypothetical protein
MESRFIMAILPQELSEVCENPSQIYNIPSETGAMLRDASLLVRKIAAPATGKGAVPAGGGR